MRIGISTACFYPDFTENAIERSGKLGFDLCEIFVNSAGEFEGYLDIFRQRLDKYGIQCVSLHPFTSTCELLYFFSGYPRRVEDGLEIYAKYFDFLKALGGKYFTFHGARALSGPSIPGESEIEVYRRLVDLAASRQIVLAQENVAWCRSAYPEYIAELSEKVEGLGFTLDVKQAKRAGFGADEYIDAMQRNLVNVHISDSDQTSTCLLPGRGDTDLKGLVQGLKRLNYKGDIIIEVYSDCFENDGQILAAGEFLKSILN